MRKDTVFKLINILKIISADKKFGSVGRNDRVTQINKILGVDRYFYTDPLNTGKRNWVVEYKRPQYWYDNRPITIKTTFELFTKWHVMLWELIGNKGSKCGFTGTMVRGVGKKNIYKFLKHESRCFDLIFDKSDAKANIDKTGIS